MLQDEEAIAGVLRGELTALRRRVRELEGQEALRRTTEEHLQDSEERFAAVVNSTSDAVITIDRLGLITLWNEGAAKMFRRSSVEMLGQPLTSVMPERFRPHHEKSLGRVLETGRSP